MKKAILFLLAATAILVFAAVSAGAEAGKESGPMEITWLAQYSEGETTSWFIEEVNKKFNVSIKLNGIAPNQADQINIMLAAGEMPDTAFMMAQDPKKLYNEGVTRGIPLAAIRKNMPNYTKMLDSKYPVGWLMNVNPSNKDERLALTSLLYYSDSILMGLLEFRIDWARKVGLDLPDYDAKKLSLDNYGRCYFLDHSVTLDWLEKLLIAFRDKDPDGNGKNDTIPWATCSDKNWSFVNIYGAFGLTHDYSRMVNGELYMPPDRSELEGFPQACRPLVQGRSHRPGVREPDPREVVGEDRERAGRRRREQHHVRRRRPGPAPQQQGEDRRREREEGRRGRHPSSAHRSPGGQQGARAYTPIGALGFDQQMVDKKVSDAKLAKILQIIDWAGAPTWRTGSIRTTGKPDVHFTWSGEPWKSTPVREEARRGARRLSEAGRVRNRVPLLVHQGELLHGIPDQDLQFPGQLPHRRAGAEVRDPALPVGFLQRDEVSPRSTRSRAGP